MDRDNSAALHLRAVNELQLRTLLEGYPESVTDIQTIQDQRTAGLNDYKIVTVVNKAAFDNYSAVIPVIFFLTVLYFFKLAAGNRDLPVDDAVSALFGIIR